LGLADELQLCSSYDVAMKERRFVKWSWKLGRFAGIDVYLHTTFVLFLVWIAAMQWMSGHDFDSMLSGVAFMIALFGSVLLHEFGHALMARKYGIGTRDITLLPIGGVSRMERMPDVPSQELAVALAGPAVNVVITLALFGFLSVTDSRVPLDELALTHGSLVERLMLANISLLLFNLLPAFPMDGGRALRGLLAMRMSYSRATRTAAGVGQVFAVIFGLVGLLVRPLLVLIAIFVWFGASEEAAATLMKASFAGIPVRKAMLTDFQSLRGDDSLARAVELILQGSQHDFPVLDENRVTGLLTRTDLIAALATHGSGFRVADAMRRNFCAVEPSEPLETVFLRVPRTPDFTIPVIERGQLVGLLTSDNIAELFMLHSALEESAQRKQYQAA
jgi:Zn-dependent protease/CBS domain-containing protein